MFQYGGSEKISLIPGFFFGTQPFTCAGSLADRPLLRPSRKPA